MKKTQTLEVTVISGENLCLDWNLVTENTYVEVRTESLKCWTTKMANKCSDSEEEGSSLGYPTWNDKLRVEVPLHAKSITFEVKCKTTSKGVARSVGLARIAISDVLKKREDGDHIVGGGALQKEGCLSLHVLSYRLRNWEGRRCGVLNFSVRELTNEEEKEENSSNLKYEKKKEMMIMDHDDDLMGDSNNNNNMNEVVMGVPVCWNHLGIHA